MRICEATVAGAVAVVIFTGRGRDVVAATTCTKTCRDFALPLGNEVGMRMSTAGRTL